MYIYYAVICFFTLTKSHFATSYPFLSAMSHCCLMCNLMDLPASYFYESQFFNKLIKVTIILLVKLVFFCPQHDNILHIHFAFKASFSSLFSLSILV